MSYDPDYEYKNAKHFRTRAVGQLVMPIQRDGYDNRVLELTANELEFKNSVAADRYLYLMKKKFMDGNQFCRAKKMKFLSKYDDR